MEITKKMDNRLFGHNETFWVEIKKKTIWRHCCGKTNSNIKEGKLNDCKISHLWGLELFLCL